jgi:hypothetical protein
MNAEEEYLLYTYVSGPVSLFSAFICGIAVITSYIYPQQRKFPNVVLLWTWYVLYQKKERKLEKINKKDDSILTKIEK